MSKYTTGEIAKLCGVSVRTVQYYDTRNILIPSELSEGGRRLYSEDDLKRMKIICFLREAGLPINSISQLLAGEHPENVVSVLLDQQAQELREEIAEAQKKLDIVEGIRRELKALEHFSVESIGDIAHVMKNKRSMKKLRAITLITGIPVTILQWVSIMLWITTGKWWLFAVWAGVAMVYATWISVYYFNRVKYICPECHEQFRPRFSEAFWAYHTPKVRRLRCPGCGESRLCIEVHTGKDDKDHV